MIKQILIVAIVAASVFGLLYAIRDVEPVKSSLAPYLAQAQDWAGSTFGGVTDGISEQIGATVNQYQGQIVAAGMGGAGLAATSIQRWWNNRQRAIEQKIHDDEMFGERQAFSDLSRLKTTLEIKNGELEAQLEKLAGADEEANKLRARVEALQAQNDRLTAERNATRGIKVDEIADRAVEKLQLQKVIE